MEQDPGSMPGTEQVMRALADYLGAETAARFKPEEIESLAREGYLSVNDLKAATRASLTELGLRLALVDRILGQGALDGVSGGTLCVPHAVT